MWVSTLCQIYVIKLTSLNVILHIQELCVFILVTEPCRFMIPWYAVALQRIDYITLEVCNVVKLDTQRQKLQAVKFS